jgi:DNA-binding MarR family transcriptional regulator
MWHKKAQLSSEREIGYLLHRLNVVMSRRIDQCLSEDIDLTLSQFLILKAAGQESHISQSKVARYLGLTEAAVSRQTDAVLERGWITRVANEANRREHVVELTPTGSMLLGRAETSIDRYFVQALASLSASECTQLKATLDKLAATVCEPMIQKEAHGKA